MGGHVVTNCGVLQFLAHAVDTDAAHWWGYALSWRQGQWWATVVPAAHGEHSLRDEAIYDEYEHHRSPEGRDDLDDVLGPTLVQALAFIATTLGVPTSEVGRLDSDLEALHALMTAEEVTSLVVAYDAVVDGVTEQEWEVYGSGGGGAFCANGHTYPETIDALSTRR